MMRRSIPALLAMVCATPAAAKDPPLALVERVENAPAARLAPYDYVYPGEVVDLRPGGDLKLAYFRACFVDTFHNGVVRITKDGARVKGGASSRAARPCETAAWFVQGGQEAGVAVKRISPFIGRGWRELTVRTDRPVFVWPAQSAGEVKLQVYLLEASPKRLVWETTATARRIAYPSDAPGLAVGLPYEVTVSGASLAPLSATFSVDPGLDDAEGLLNAVVPLGF